MCHQILLACMQINAKKRIDFRYMKHGSHSSSFQLELWVAVVMYQAPKDSCKENDSPALATSTVGSLNCHFEMHAGGGIKCSGCFERCAIRDPTVDVADNPVPTSNSATKKKKSSSNYGSWSIPSPPSPHPRSMFLEGVSVISPLFAFPIPCRTHVLT